VSIPGEGGVMKKVLVTGYQFDSLPGHVQCTAGAKASNLRAAVAFAVRDMLKSPELKHKQFHSFRISVVIFKETKEE
jgi:hypothetical protein